MAFEGFKKDGVGFFKMLAIQQDREWFKANKPHYDALWEAPMKALLDELQPKVAKTYGKLKLQKPKMFRVYRDVRFSKDKRPYKTHAAAVIALEPRSGASNGAAALYLHLGLEDDCGAGHWMMDPPMLLKYRKLVAADRTGKELAKRLAALEKKGFTASSFEKLKRVPKGFDPEHPRAELLKHKGLGIEFPKVPASVRYSPKLAGWLSEQVKAASSVVIWLEQQLRG